MVVTKIQTGINTRLPVPHVESGEGVLAQTPTKSLGEAPPIKLDLAQIGDLATQFAKGGTLFRLLKKLNRLKNKNCTLVPSSGTIACVDGEDQIYVGIEFLKKFLNQPEVLAGVLAHEVGHTLAQKPTPQELEVWSWDKIFAERRAHEAFADEVAGRLLALMGYQPQPFLDFLLNELNQTHNFKYHEVQIRLDLVRAGYNDEAKKIKLAHELFKDDGYRSEYQSTLLDDDV